MKVFRSIVISVSDFDRSLAFYRDLLDFTIVEYGSALGVLNVFGGHILRPACAVGWPMVAALQAAEALTQHRTVCL